MAEFCTRRRQRSLAAGQAATGARLTEPWMCSPLARRRWAARAAARNPEQLFAVATRPAFESALARSAVVNAPG